jgi:HEAT repeat protein
MAETTGPAKEPRGHPKRKLRLLLFLGAVAVALLTLWIVWTPVMTRYAIHRIRHATPGEELGLYWCDLARTAVHEGNEDAVRAMLHAETKGHDFAEAYFVAFAGCSEEFLKLLDEHSDAHAKDVLFRSSVKLMYFRDESEQIPVSCKTDVLALVEYFKSLEKSGDLNARRLGPTLYGYASRRFAEELAEARKKEEETARRARGPAPERIRKLLVKLESADPQERSMAAEKLGDLRFAAKWSVPHLAKTLLANKGSSETVLALMSIGCEDAPALLPLLDSPHKGTREAAIEIFAGIGVPMPQAVPKLVEALDNSDGFVRGGAARALSKMGPEGTRAATQKLLRMLGSGDMERRRRGASGMFYFARESRSIAPQFLALFCSEYAPTTKDNLALLVGRTGQETKAAKTELLKLLKSPYEHTRLVGAEAYWRLTGDATGVMVTITSVLSDERSPWRHNATRLLFRMHEHARPALKHLKSAMSDTRPSTSVPAARSVWYLTARHQEPMKALIAAFSKDVDPKWAAVEAMLSEFYYPEALQTLGEMGAAAGPAAPHVAGFLRSKECSSLELEEDVLNCLADIGHEAQEASGAVLEYLRKAPPGMRVSAAVCLARISPRSKRTAAELSRLLSKQDAVSREAGARALGELKSVSPESKRALKTLLKDPDPHVRLAACETLWQPDCDKPAILNVLQEILGDKYSGDFIRTRAATFVCTLGADAKPLLPTLEAVSKEEYGPTRCLAVGALCGALGKKNHEELLWKWLKSPDHAVRSAAAYALPKAGLKPARLAAGLATAMNDPHSTVRGIAARALGEFSDSVPSANKMLEKLLVDMDPYVRQDARRALVKRRRSAAQKDKK